MKPRFAAAALLGASLLVLARGEQLVRLLGGPPQCSYRARTGLDCMGCGGTRAFALAARGEIHRAARANLLGAYFGLSAWLLAAGSAWTLATSRVRPLLAGAGGAAAAFLPVFFAAAVAWLSRLPAG